MKPLILFLAYAASTALLAAAPSFTVDAGHPSGKVSPRLYGLMTEEINHAYDGGLYAELLRNRAFLDDAKTPICKRSSSQSPTNKGTSCP
jgi:alpha-N-arabinofuranosidase